MCIRQRCFNHSVRTRAQRRLATPRRHLIKRLVAAMIFSANVTNAVSAAIHMACSHSYTDTHTVVGLYILHAIYIVPIVKELCRFIFLRLKQTDCC